MEHKNVWESYSAKQLKELEALSAEYIDFLSECKTERECVDYIVNVIENAAKSYYYQTSSGTKITLEELANNKYIDPDITNPKTNEKMTGCVIVSKDNGYNTFKYIDDLSLCD